MEKNVLSISSGSSCFLVKDHSLKTTDAPFYQWLQGKGFGMWKNSHGCYADVDWVYINLNSKLFTPGMPGILITTPIGEHAITISEFKTILSIYERYAGKKPLEF